MTRDVLRRVAASAGCTKYGVQGAAGWPLGDEETADAASVLLRTLCIVQSARASVGVSSLRVVAMRDLTSGRLPAGPLFSRRS